MDDLCKVGMTTEAYGLSVVMIEIGLCDMRRVDIDSKKIRDETDFFV